jgi:hypothetical protein
LRKRFDRPTAIFAPNPGVMKDDGGKPYNYIRPLATIEPTAIALGLPVNTAFGLDDIAGLQAALLKQEYRSATLIVAWEHRLLDQLAHDVLKQSGGMADKLPKWKANDFDSLYVIRITSRGDAQRSATFEPQRQGLDGQSTTCPGAAP